MNRRPLSTQEISLKNIKPSGAKRDGKSLTTREDWVRLGLWTIAHHGLSAVKIDRICSELGVTRGSFYWHFESRDELIAAALEYWLNHSTTEVLAKLRESPDPAIRLRRLLKGAYRDLENGLLFSALSASSQDPRVKDTVRSITEVRLAFLTECYEDLGKAPEDAYHHALLTYSAYLGLYEIMRTLPTQGPRALGEEQVAIYIQHLTQRLVDDVDGA